MKCCFLITHLIVLLLPTGMTIHNSGANRGQKRTLYTGTKVTDGLKAPYRYWELDMGPLIISQFS